MNVAKLIEKRYGILTRATRNPLVEELNEATLQLLPNNPNRLGWMAVNLSANNIFLALDIGVSAEHGILLTPNGGSFTMFYEEDFEATCWAVYGMAGADASDIFVIEVLIDREIGEGV